ncbi:retinol dehydrogenase 11-like [Amphiura filiformis]|uniref:retinol dehydrogenase 11-like n=1 Tax=Amphiura filiformis TaxID=82378 RepID=UPI003B22569B
MTWLKVTGAALVGSVSALYGVCYFRYHRTRRVCKSSVTLEGKTVIITGGNTGIGKETAVDIARRGARVVLACRSKERTQPAIEEIKKRSGNEKIFFKKLDLSSFDSVKHFAKEFLQEEPRLDILINNAGLAFGSRGETTSDGFDVVFGTNHFGHFLLTMLLVDRLKESAPSRIVTLSSCDHKGDIARPTFDSSALLPKIENNVRYPNLYGYPRSKQANIMVARQLAKELKGTGVTTYSVHPGFVNTGIWNNILSPTLRNLMYPFIWLFCINEEMGAQTTVYCAVEESITHLSGNYFTNCQLAHPSEIHENALDDNLAKKLLDLSFEATGLEEEITDAFTCLS